MMPLQPPTRLAISIARGFLIALAVWISSATQRLVPISVIPAAWGEDSYGGLLAEVEPRMVKVFGATGGQRLEGYQSGFLVSPAGHIATVWSYVLDTAPTIVLHDGRRFNAEVLSIEPQLELALLKIPAEDLEFFSLDASITPRIGQRVLALSNAYGVAVGSEASTIMRGHVAARSKLESRRGLQASNYRGPILVLDLIANNPGAAGGALVDVRGQLLGMLGKEVRDSKTGAWLNYAVPVSELKPTLVQLIKGEAAPAKTVPAIPKESWTLERMGLLMVPDLLEVTPAYIDSTNDESPAAKAGLQSDDLILLINNERFEGQLGLREQLRFCDARDPVALVVQRGDQILSISIAP
jgi:S1-C subfamily serine protease